MAYADIHLGYILSARGGVGGNDSGGHTEFPR